MTFARAKRYGIISQSYEIYWSRRNAKRVTAYAPIWLLLIASSRSDNARATYALRRLCLSLIGDSRSGSSPKLAFIG